MPAAARVFVPNQIFVGLPWKNVRPKYDRIIVNLKKSYPLHFTIVGRNDDDQSATALYGVIKSRIDTSSEAIFDATGGNANVSLEYGYAEGRGVQSCIFVSSHRASQRNAGAEPIISDLSGMRRVQYTNEGALLREMRKYCKAHAYTKRFERALSGALRRQKKGKKKSGRTMALKLIHALDGKDSMRRSELVQQMEAQGYTAGAIEKMLSNLHRSGVLKCTPGRTSYASVR